ncbi:hypothetical protein, partial [Mesorhizobium sp. WSM4982]|uniref:hypothetical protein n=1 Tax=Mesorhizobium sp. WSM4982 TaxID=3038550 RepID=UPI0024158C56
PDVREDFRYSSQNEKLLGSMRTKWSYNGWAHTLDETCDRWEAYAPVTAQLAIAVTTGIYAVTVATVESTSTNAAGLTKGSTIIDT